MKLWAGRFQKETDTLVNDFNSSISFDARLYREDIQGSMAHATMLGAVGVLEEEESRKIVEGLEQILQDLKEGRLAIDPQAEDIHMFVEQVLTSRLGDLGKKLHTGRSRNDQVALDVRLYLANQEEELIELVEALCACLCDLAQEHLTTVMPGYTHLQRAQPITLAHQLMAYVQMLLRDRERLQQTRERTRLSPLGSGALAGTTYPLDRQLVAEKLGLAGVTENSLDGVSDRDFVLELSADLSILMMHLSRMAEEIILWCSSEFRFLALSDRFSTGSSIMPQKKNPDIAELIRGKTARVYGHHMTLLAMMKALPLAYNKDMQEDKEAIFDIVDTVKLCLFVLPPMWRSATFYPENMRAAAAGGFINATDCADYLVKKGLPFRDAYKITGQLVALCIEKGLTLETLPLSEYQALSPLFDDGVYQAIDLLSCVSLRKVYGGPAAETVAKQIENARRKLV